MRKKIIACSLLLVAAFARAAIPLTGVTGEKLRARAFFDVNNVKVGDPLVLTVDFIGTADFKALHPPALSKAVSRKDWKLDDSSAKTQTESQRVGNFFSSHEVAVARRLTYRVRPMREGVLWFPALEFEYETPSGEKRRVRANEIPVHAKPGVDVVVAEMGEDDNQLPQPDPLLTDPGTALDDDANFAWRRALRVQTADAFAPFDFPAAKLNEACCAIHSNDWKRALSLYHKLEWRIGQTPAIEHGIRAAQALRYGNPAADIPIWRQVGRPLLKYGWRGRVGLLVGGILAIVAVFWTLGRIIRALACVGLVLALALPAVGAPQKGAARRATDPFAALEQMHQRMEQQMQQMMSGPFGGGGFSMSFGGEEEKAPEVKARLELDEPAPRVGETFNFIVSLEVPKGVTLEPSSFSASETFGLTFVTGRGERLTDGKPSSPSNTLFRVAIPARYDVPFRGDVSFSVGGRITGHRTGGRAGHFSFTFSNSFETRTQAVAIEVKPLENPPVGFSGIVATSLRFAPERADTYAVETNDVMRLAYRIDAKGWIPEDWMPGGAAFEANRQTDRTGQITAEWQAYFVANGTNATPRVCVIYYDPQAKVYKTARTGGSRITYKGGRSVSATSR